MNNNEILRLVEQRLKALGEVQEDLVKLQNDNPEVFEMFYNLTERYNTSWDECKNLLKSVETDQALRIGPFSRDRKSVTTKFKPSLIPDAVLAMPGVVKTVDDKLIAELITQGIISQSEIEDARYEYARTPSIRSPLQRATLPTLVAEVK